MSKIERITGTQVTLPAPRRQAVTAPQHVEPARHASEARDAAQSQAGLGRLPLAATRPVAAFLAQYVDQHARWPYSPTRKQEKRTRAASAYIDADLLPDMLIDALRLPKLERKL